MAGGDREPDENTHLLPNPSKDNRAADSQPQDDLEIGSIHSTSMISHISKEEQALAFSSVGERLPYNDYTTIDFLHDLIKDSFRLRKIKSARGFRARLFALWDAASGWIASAVIGILTACVAFLVDIAVSTVSDWKTGYCAKNLLAGKEMCCTDKAPFLALSNNASTISSLLWNFGTRKDAGILGKHEAGETCADWVSWGDSYISGFAIYVGFALAFGIVSGSVTLLTKSNLPAASPDSSVKKDTQNNGNDNGNVVNENSGNPKSAPQTGKAMYMAAGSGIPEIKTILSGFVIPNLLGLKVLIVKAVGSIFAVSTSMCLGKEGPFVHISTCVAYLVGNLIPKYRDNGRKMRELLSSGCASGMSVAFGAPIGGVLFSYEVSI